MAEQAHSAALDADPVAPIAPEAPACLSQIEMDALQWQMILWSGEESAEERQAFHDWLAAEPAHQRAWQRIQLFSTQVHAAPSAIAGTVLRSTLSPQASRTRRNLLRGFVLLAGGGVSAYAVRQTPQWSIFSADYSTARGERRDMTLPDGTLMSLNTASAVDLNYTDSERRLLFRTGEVLISTAPDNATAHRPFIVQTSEGRVRALGTKFLVRRLEHGSPTRIAVQVFDGAVEITPDHGAASLRVNAGQQADFTRYDTQGPIDGDPQVISWQQGLLVAERWRLDDFLAELSRYRPGVVRCDPAVADLIISGVYPLGNTDTILKSLPRALPVSVRSTTRYWVTVTTP